MTHVMSLNGASESAPGTFCAPFLHPFRGTVTGVDDGESRLYVLEQWRDRRLVQRGIVGGLDLAAVGDGRVQRHEGVLDSQVSLLEGRMRRMGGCDEPILLLARGPGSSDSRVAALTAGPPDSVVGRPDGGEQRLWRGRFGHPAEVSERLLVADGHHRLAAALRIHRSNGGRPGPWSRLPALVVDAASHPPALSAIHRAVPGADIGAAVRTVSRFARVRRRDAGRLTPPGPGCFLLCGRGQVWQVSQLDPALVRARLRGLPPQWSQLDSALADHVLIPQICADQRITERQLCVHQVPEPCTSGQVGVVLAPPTAAQIWAHADSGVAMPRKSSFFGPKPTAGQLAYLVREQ